MLMKEINGIDQYNLDFVDHWDNLIDWEKRSNLEKNFFHKILNDYDVKSIIDVATGTGYNSIKLLEKGFDVLSVDGNQRMLDKAKQNAKNNNISIKTIKSKWIDLNNKINDKFDCLLCLGNSFTHIFSHSERVNTLKAFYDLLKPGGIILIDQRNYDIILDHGIVLNSNPIYCNDNVKVTPEFVDSKKIKYVYSFSGNKEFHLNMYPLRKKYFINILISSQFSVLKTYGDYKYPYNNKDVSFFTHLGIK